MPSEAQPGFGADALNELTKAPISDIYTVIKSYTKLGYAKFFEDFSRYCNYMAAKAAYVRTLYSKTKSIALSDVYVSTAFFDTKRVRISNSEIEKRFASGDRIIVKGNGGSGKTFFVKWLWLNRFRSGSGRIPILVELRRVSDLATMDLMAFCRSELQAESIFGKGVFENLCQDGRFEIIFDGFDEVSKDRRKSLERQILDMAEKFRKCSFLVTGRDDDRFSGWGPFEVYDVAPMSLEEVRILVQKIPFDNKVKKRFLENFNDQFYRDHRSFLSNPLLSIMMLMTFHDNAVIPTRLTTFYDHAFQTMLTWHDATKDSFERQRALSLDDFRKIFSTFCLLTYYKQTYEFDEKDFRRYVASSLKYHSILADVDDVVGDMCESVNLIQRDGLKYVFIHRSFQEYFAAECAMLTVSGKAREFLTFFSRRQRDSVLQMAYELHPELFIDEFIVPRSEDGKLKEIYNNLRSKKSMILVLGLGSEGMFDSPKAGHRNGYWILPGYDQLMEPLEFLDACNRVFEGRFGVSPIDYFSHRIYKSVEVAMSQYEGDWPESALVLISVKAIDGSLKFSLRNREEKKLSAAGMRSLRALVVKEVNKALPEIEKGIRDYITAARDFLDERIASRRAQAESIEQILQLM